MGIKTRTEKETQGLGIIVPPLRLHVLLYFNQKGQPEQVANCFFERYQQINWKNQKGKTIKNWKVHAWQWIWYKN